jgi:hypothetical protein
MQRLSDALHGTLGFYLRDALHEGSANAVACLPVPRALACGVLPSLLVFAWWFSLLFLVKKLYYANIMLYYLYISIVTSKIVYKI